MCGRAYSQFNIEDIDLRYGRTAHDGLSEIKPNYNIAPTQSLPVVFMKEGKLHLQMMRWGLIPFWAKDIKSTAKYSLINAKLEDVEMKRSYRSAFEKRRCIVPLSGFYEWLKGDGKTKRPFAIFLKQHPIMSVAGIWESWEGEVTDPESDSAQRRQIIHSVSLMTTNANPFMEKIHDRMPLILAEKQESFWLDPKHQDIQKIRAALQPLPNDELEAYEVSTLVNSPRNNRREVLDRL